MEHQETQKSQLKKQYTQDDMYYIAELYGEYYLTINDCSSHRRQINKKD